MNHLFVKTVKYFVTLIFVLFLLIWLLSPQISSHFIQQQLTPQALVLGGQSHVRYNPFLSKLSVENFVITKNKSIVLAIKKLDLGISLYQLLFDKIYIKQFDIDGFFIKIRQDQQREEIAGFSLNKPAQNTNPPAPSAPLNYELILPLVKIQNAKVGYESNGRKLEFIATYLNSKDVTADSNKQSGQFQLNGKLDQAIINLSGKFNILAQQGVISSDIDITQLDLSLFSPWLPKQNQITSGLLTLSGQQKIQLIDDKANVDLTNSQVKIEQLELAQDKIAISVDQQEFYAPDLTVSLAKDKTVDITGQAKYTLERLAIANYDNKQLLLASIRNVSLPIITIDQTQASQLISLPTVDISKIILSDELNTDLPPILRIEQTQIVDVNISATKTEIDTATIRGLAIDTYISPAKNIENLNPIQSFIAKNDAIEVKSAPTIDSGSGTQTGKDVVSNQSAQNTASNSYRFVLNQLRFLDAAKINLVDASVKPAYKRKYTIEKFELGPIDTHNPTQETILTIAGQGDEHEKFNLTSVNKLFAPKPSYSVKGYINEVDLSAISPYVQDSLKHQIKSGQLNLKIDTNVVDDQLSGDTNLLIRHIEFATKIDSAPDAINTTASMPLNVALDMLKDSDGNVDLSIPLAGDINSPEFGIISITTFLVKKASMMAAKDYLMKTFVPYANVVSVAMSAADAILKVRFNDLFFVPKQIETAVTDDVFLLQFAQLLIDKPETHVTVCPIAVPEDINIKSGTKITAPEQIEQLNNISRQRFNYFKNLMNKQYKIETSRLIMCAPSIDDSDKAKPRLSFST